MNKSGKKDYTQLILLVILLSFLAIIDIATLYIWKSTSSPVISSSGTETITVAEIISGDTIILDNGKTVRLLGINAPDENQPYYQESIDMLKFLILDKKVRLEKDAVEDDGSGNLLRYVYVEYNREELFVNKESVSQGYSLPLNLAPNTKHKSEIDAARQECIKDKIRICA